MVLRWEKRKGEVRLNWREEIARNFERVGMVGRAERLMGGSWKEIG